MSSIFPHFVLWIMIWRKNFKFWNNFFYLLLSSKASSKQLNRPYKKNIKSCHHYSIHYVMTPSASSVKSIFIFGYLRHASTYCPQTAECISKIWYFLKMHIYSEDQSKKCLKYKFNFFVLLEIFLMYRSHLIWDICLLLENLLLCLIARFFPYSCLGRSRSQWPTQAALREKSSDETHFK